MLLVATIAAALLAGSIAQAQQIGNVLSDSLGSINQCYHGMSTPNPCTTNSWIVAGAIYGRWRAEKGPLVLDFSPDWDIKTGTVWLQTIGPAKQGTYRISAADRGEFPTLVIDLAEGQPIRVSIAFFGLGELVMMDEQGTITFHRP